MDVQSVTNQVFSDNSLKVKKAAEKNELNSGSTIEVKKDTYQHVETPKKVTYKADLQTIRKLKDELDKNTEQTKQLILAMFQRQGLNAPDLSDIQIADLKNLKVDKTAQEQAEAMISEGGELSAENVSNRIVDFAKAISGGDTSKMDQLKAAVDKAFKEVKQMFGNEELPEVTQNTYTMIMDKLDAWGKEESTTKQQGVDVQIQNPA